MPPFQYEPFQNTLAPTIAEILAHQGDPYARAAEQSAAAQAQARQASGNVWGRAVEQVGQIPQQIQQQRDAQQQRQLRAQQMQATTMDLQDRTQQRQLATQQRVVTTIGTLAKGAETPDEFLASVNNLVALGGLTKEVGAHIADTVTKAGPDGYGSTRKQYIDFAAQFVPNVKLGEGDKLTNPLSGHVVAEGGSKPVDLAPGHVLLQPPTAPGGTAAPLASAPFAPGTGQHVVNGQVVDATGAPVGAQVPKQETPSEAAVNTARVTELAAQAKKIDAELAGTMPVTETDKLRLGLERVRINNELEHYRMIERKEDPATPANQEKLEQQYRGVLTRTLSSRSGGMGLEDTKVNQAKHLIALFDQTKNAKGEYEIPRVMQTEIAMGLARLISPTGVVGEGTLNAIDQKTAKGDLAGTLTYLTGHPFTGSTQDIFKMYRDSIERQGKVAEGNRESYLNSMRAFAPTDLAENRRQQLEKGLGLNRLDSGGSALGPNATHIVEQGGVRYKVTTDATGKVVTSEPVP